MANKPPVEDDGPDRAHDWFGIARLLIRSVTAIVLDLISRGHL